MGMVPVVLAFVHVSGVKIILQDITIGVYKAGFAHSQSAYAMSCQPVWTSWRSGSRRREIGSATGSPIGT